MPVLSLSKGGGLKRLFWEQLLMPFDRLRAPGGDEDGPGYRDWKVAPTTLRMGPGPSDGVCRSGIRAAISGWAVGRHRIPLRSLRLPRRSEAKTGLCGECRSGGSCSCRRATLGTMTSRGSVRPRLTYAGISTAGTSHHSPLTAEYPSTPLRAGEHDYEYEDELFSRRLLMTLGDARNEEKGRFCSSPLHVRGNLGCRDQSSLTTHSRVPFDSAQGRRARLRVRGRAVLEAG
jgi:hypothetical protein